MTLRCHSSNKWVGEYGFDIELVKAACSKTISAIQKPSFEYTDSILANWRKKDVHTLKDVEVLDANFAKANKASATGSSQRHKCCKRFLKTQKQ